MLWSSWLSVVLLQWLLVAVVEVEVRAQRQPGGRDCVVDGVSMCQYESHREMINKLQSLQSQYPHIVKVESFQSIQQHKLFPSRTGWLYREVSVGTTLGVRQAEQRCWSAELPRADGEVCGKHAR